MKSTLCALLMFVSPVALAQDQATTLAAACDKSTVVVLATVTAATDPSPEFHRLEWNTDEVLSGQIGGQFTLLEPSGACCGRSLFALAVGDRRLLFLQRTGARLHPFGGSRGVLTPNPALLGHVRSLLDAATPAARSSLLAASLDHPQPRIALDAAHAMASMPSLALANADKQRIREALQLAVRRSSTSAAPLLDVTVRSADATMLDTALALYVAEPQDGKARLLRRGLSRVAPSMLTTRLQIHRNGDASAQLRVAQLLRTIPGAHGESALVALLHRTTCPRVQLCATEGLLTAGAPATTLRRTVPVAVLELATQRVRSARFRSIDPGSR